MLLSQDEMRVQMVPTLQTTLGVKGERPVVGTRDNKDVVHVFGSVDVQSGRVISDLVESRYNDRCSDGSNKTRRMQEAFARHIEHVARAYPTELNKPVIVIIDGAPWHRGRLLNEVLARNPHVTLYQLPGYSPELNPIERLWKTLRREVTHNRLFEKVSDLARALARRLLRFKRQRWSVLQTIGPVPASLPAP